jgi:hypothetical protein
VNRALRFSLRIDSDQDGIPNGLDPTPFGTSSALAAQVTMKTGALEIRFQAEGQTSYTIEYTDQLANPDWKVLRQVTNSESVPWNKCSRISWIILRDISGSQVRDRCEFE